MIVSPLRLALCSNRCQIVTDTDPNTWIAAALPCEWALYSFHFFVDWRNDPPPVSDTILMARLVDFEAHEDPYSVTDQSVLKAFRESKADVYFDNLERVLKRYAKKVVSILFPEFKDGSIVDETPIWTVSRDETNELHILRSTLSKLKKSIEKHSGGMARVGKKKLVYGTSAIECALSRTDYAFPGDADAVVVDGNGRIHCILEYKKHTKDEPIGDHLVSRYYPRPDGRKFKRLASLVTNLNQYDRDYVKVIVLYYSMNLLQMRIQAVGKVYANSIEVIRDSGEFSIDGMSDMELSKKILTFLEISDEVTL